MRDQVRQSVTANLESSQRCSRRSKPGGSASWRAGGDPRREPDAEGGARHLSGRGAHQQRPAVKAQLLATIDGELDKLAATRRVRRHRAGRHAPEHAGRGGPAWATAGRAAGRCRSSGARGRDLRRHRAHRRRRVPRRRRPAAVRATARPSARCIWHQPRPALRRGARALAGTRTAIVSDGLLVASTLPAGAARAVRGGGGRGEPADAGTITLGGESYAFRRLVAVGDTMFYALGSIDESSRGATRNAMRSLA